MLASVAVVVFAIQMRASPHGAPNPAVSSLSIGAAPVAKTAVDPQRSEAAENPGAPAALPTPSVPNAIPAVLTPPVARITGRVVARTDLDVKSKTNGEVLKVHVDVGDPVKQGQLLIELDPTDGLNQIRRSEVALAMSKSRLEQARESLAIAELGLTSMSARAAASVRSATAKAARARSRADRYKQTLTKKVISQEEYDEAEATAVEAAANLDMSKVQFDDVKGQELSLQLKREDVSCAEAQITINELALKDAQQYTADKKIYATMDGTVTGRFVHPGQVVSAGTYAADTRLMTLSDLSRLFVVAQQCASKIGKIKVNQQVTIRSEAFPNELFKGIVIRTAPCGTVCEKDVTFGVKIEILGENRSMLKPEMQVSVEF